MRASRIGLSCRLLFAFFAIIAAPSLAAAQDMPPILAPLAPAAVASNPTPPVPSAQAVIPPAVVEPGARVDKHAGTDHPANPHHEAKAAARQNARFTALTKRLAAHAHPVTHRVAVRGPEPALPPGAVVPPPGYYPTGPYERLVYGGPPRGPYGGWGGYWERYR
jgi:hypothetical protein